MNRFSVIIYIISFFYGLSVYAAVEPDTLNREKLKLIHADKWIDVVTDGRQVSTLEGNVKLKQGDALLSCDTGEWKKNGKIIILKKNVKIFDGEHTLWADIVEYNGNTCIETARGNVVLYSGDRKLNADKVIYHQKTKVSKAFGNVIIRDLVENAELRGEETLYDRINDYVYITGNPYLVKGDSSSDAEIMVEGLRIEIWGDEQKVEISDSVKIIKGELKASSQKSLFYPENDSLILFGLPVVWHKQHKMKGDTIYISLIDFKFNGGIIKGSAEIVTKDSTTEDILQGKTITITAVMDTIRELLVEEQAISIYSVDDNNEKGVNLLTGDSIRLIFENDSLKYVYVSSKPGLSTGKYVPEDNKGSQKKDKKE